MRARNLKPGLFRDADLTECSITARWLFAGLGCLADCKGRFENRPKQIKMELMPCDDVDIPSLLQELADHGLIRFYGGTPEGGLPYVWIPTFEKDQNPHHTEMKKGSKIPPHPEELPTATPTDEPEISGALKEDTVFSVGISGSTLGNSGSTPGNSGSNPADSRLPIPDSRLLIADSRFPIPDSATCAPSVGRSVSANIDSAGSVSADGRAYRDALWKRTKAVVMHREGEPPEGRDPPWKEPWWRDTAKRAADAGKLPELEGAVSYAEDCRDLVKRRAKDLGELKRPAAFVAGKLRDAGVQLPRPLDQPAQESRAPSSSRASPRP